jgi:hypothetical protein
MDVNAAATLSFARTISQDVTFNNNAGVTVETGGTFLINSFHNITAPPNSTGVILNQGMVQDDGTGALAIKVDLPLINNTQTATLQVTASTLEFTQAGQQTAQSVQQNNGKIILQSGASLNADKGLTMKAGDLWTYGAGTCTIGGGTVTISGGEVTISEGV